MMRAQLQAEFTYSSEEGPMIPNPDHDKKCRSILETAKEEYADLLLLPEYCVSYKLLEELIGNEDLWPDYQKLWCLPCQGIPWKEFKKWIGKIENDKVLVIKDALEGSGVKSNHFANVLFYCFTAESESGDKEQKLILVPQLKTQNMADGMYLCEGEGMVKGNVIYVIGGQEENRIVTLLCADSLNAEIQWEPLRDKAGGKSLTILHPQLNTKPKHDTFSGIRQKIFEYCTRSVHITCNWAAGTRLVKASDKGSAVGADEEKDDRFTMKIDLPWSCIYYKYEDKRAWEEWLSQKETFHQNGEKALYGAFMKSKRVAVWYAGPEEVIHLVRVKKPGCNAYAVLLPSSDVCVKKRFDFRKTGTSPEPGESVYSLLHNIPTLQKEYQDLAKKYLSEDQYNFPLFHGKKDEVEQFFALISLCQRNSVYEIDKDENLKGFSLLLDEAEREKAREGLRAWNELIRQIEKTGFPRHLESFQKDFQFSFAEADEKAPCGNIVRKSGEERLIAGVSPDTGQAERFVKSLCRDELRNYIGDDLDRAAYLVCVYGKNLISGEYEAIPRPNTDISCGTTSAYQGDITDGG